MTLRESFRFLKKTLESWARATKFIQRVRNLDAFSFLALMTVGHVGMKHPSLAGMVSAISVPMTREAMHARFTPLTPVPPRRARCYSRGARAFVSSAVGVTTGGEKGVHAAVALC